MLLLLDNRDSFVFNLDQAFRKLGAATEVVRSDRTTARELFARDPWGIVLSPGPGRPEHAGCLLDVVREAPPSLPILGVCLGHQALAIAAGATITQAAEVFHGRVSEIVHDGRGLFEGIPSPIEVCRYHSLAITGPTAPDGYLRTAHDPKHDLVMAIEHESLPRFGVQFHPESFRTPLGPRMLESFWKLVCASRARIAG
ncbi:MAG: aminodeoxychorismate/anthranilate synthase component II [Planctomycetes bacterium]|nr:aminodeoxychorismate/anthranilate synthase component II [Planctomycetota bacterium]